MIGSRSGSGGGSAAALCPGRLARGERGGEAGFRVVIDGETIDTASQTDAAEGDWTTRSVPVPDRGARRAALEFVVTASGTMNYLPSAEAWIDDLRIA